jgi:L-lysine exporter family protein LysE/ArgO
MGIRLIINKKEIKYSGQNEQLSLLKIIGLSFSVAWLNPQAIIDGTMLFGGMRSSLPDNSANLFITGVCAASMVWFTALAVITNKILDKFKMEYGQTVYNRSVYAASTCGRRTASIPALV